MASKLENRIICISITIATVFLLLACLKFVHYALTIPSAIILLTFSIELSLKRYLRKRVRELDKN